jgi:polysaccharide biosynthesis/export protein
MKKSLIAIILLISIFSCTRFKDITYLRGLGKTSSDSLIKTTYTFYKVQPFDMLYIRVSNTLNQEAVEMFNQPASNSSGSNIGSGINSGMSFYLMGYNIDTEGKIKMPVLGDIVVNGMTVKEIEEHIHQLVTKYVSDADVQVRLLSFKITMLGETGVGQKTISADRANLLEVFAMSGDIYKSGNRHNILILRTTPEGMRSFRVDVTDKSIISSPLFYVQPNDIIYVEPIRSSAWRLSLSEFSLLLTAITSFTSLYFLIVNLSK